MENKIPSNFIKQYKRVEDWHFDKRNKLYSIKNNQFEFLQDSFPKWKQEYKEEITKIATVTFDLGIEIQSFIKEYVKTSELFNAYLKVPFYKHIIEKPRGYAGDSEMMKMMYRNEFEGEDIFSQFFA